MTILMGIAAVAAAAIGGVFFAFSTFVIGALARLPASQGLLAMQSINIVAITPMFMTALFGTAAACVVLSVDAATAWRGIGSASQLIGAASYLAGVIGVTMAANVPLNNALAAADPGSRDGERLWASYLQRWAAWNHVRTISGLAAGALLGLACVSRS